MLVVCRYYHTAVIMHGGALYTFGRNDYGQLGLGHRENAWRPHVRPFTHNAATFWVLVERAEGSGILGIEGNYWMSEDN